MRTWQALIAGVLAVTQSSSFAGAVSIDDFSTAQAVVSDPGGGATSAAAAAAIGGRRGLAAKLRQGAGPVTTAVAGGVLTFAVTDTTPNSRGEAVVTWDGDNNPNLLSFFGTPQDLTTSGHRSLRIVVNAATAGTELELEVYTDAASSSVAALRLPAVGAPATFFLSYGPGGDFVPRLGGGADFTTVGAIVMTVRGTETAASIDLVETAGPIVAATKRDLDLANATIVAPQTPGGTFKYRVTITNTGGEARRVDFSDVNADPNLTIDPATADATPIARNDAYRTLGNVPLTVAAGANLYDCDPSNGGPGAVGLLDNDCDADTVDEAPPNATRLAVTTVGAIATTLGGTANVAADGSFTYTPPAGVGRAVDTFTYTLADDDGNTANATATIDLGRRIWFVDDAHPGANLGTLIDPFVGFTAGNVGGAGGAGDQDGPEDLIFLFAGTYATGIELEADQILWGQGEALVLDGMTLVPAATSPTITSAANGITLATNNTLRALTVGNTAGVDVLGSNFGTLTVSAVTLNGNGGALNLTNGTLAATFGSIASTNSTGRGINLDTVTGSLTVTGATTITDSAAAGIRVTNGGSIYGFGATTLSSTNSGLDLANNATSTFDFASLAVTTDAGPGLLVNNSGTLNLGGASNTIAATGGAAIDISGTSLGSGATFATLASSGSTAQGVRLSSVTGNLSSGTTTVTNSAGVGITRSSSPGTASFGATTVDKSATNGVGVQLASNAGATTFATLAITTNNGTGLLATTNTGAINVGSAAGSSIAATAGAAIDITNAAGNPPINLSFTTLTTTNSPTNGLNLDRVGGTGLTVTGSTSLDMAPGSANAIDLTNLSTTTLAVSNSASLTINDRRATGIFLDNVSGTVGFGATSIPNPNNVGGYGIRVEDSSAQVTVASATITNTRQLTNPGDAGSDGIPDGEGDGDAIYLSSTTGSFTLNGGNLSSLATDGIDCRACRNLTVRNTTINAIGTNSTNPTTIDDAGIFAYNIQGNNLVEDSTISRFQGEGIGELEHGISLVNNNVGFTEFRIDNVDFFNDNVVQGDDAIYARTLGATVNGRLVIENGSTINLVSGQSIEVDHEAIAGTFELDVLDTTITNGTTIGTGPIDLQTGATIGTSNLFDVELRRTTLTNVGSGNANAGMIQIGLSGSGQFTGVIDDCDITGPAGPDRAGIRVITSGVDNEFLHTFNLEINNNDINDVGDDAVFIHVRGEALVASGNPANVRITNNRFGQVTAVGQDGLEGITIRIGDQAAVGGAKTMNLLLSGNYVRNLDNSAGDETFDLDSENTATLNATVTNNTFVSGGLANNEFSGSVEAATASMCLDFRNNTVTQGAGPAGNGTFELNNTAGGTFQASNSGNLGTLVSSGTITPIGSCPTPP